MILLFRQNQSVSQNGHKVFFKGIKQRYTSFPLFEGVCHHYNPIRVTKFQNDPASGSDNENHLMLSRTWKDAFYTDRRTVRKRSNLREAGKYSKGVRTGRKKKIKGEYEEDLQEITENYRGRVKIQKKYL